MSAAAAVGARAAEAEGCPSREGMPGPDRRELVSRGSQRGNQGEWIVYFIFLKIPFRCFFFLG